MSIVSVDNIQPIGSGTTVTVNKSVTLESGNTNITGVCTATSFSGSGANLTGVLSDLVNDSSPQLGGNLDTNSFEILLDDSHAVKFGSNNELEMFHASNGISKIEDNGGGFHIRQINNGDIHIHAGTNTGTSNNRLVARAAGSAELHYSGNKKLETTNTGATVTGNLAFASGNGIDFSAAGNAGGMTNELLSDYEEGTWTPSFTQGVSGGSYTIQAGHYTKVGRLVMISCRIDGNGLSANSDHLLLGGLPFTTVASGGTAGGLYFAYSDNMYSGSSGTNLALTIIVNNNNTVCEFFDGDGTQKIGTDFYDVNRNIHIVGTYHAA